jgi:hypothetical protein
MCLPRAEITTAVALQITGTLFNSYSLYEKAVLASIRSRFGSSHSFLPFAFFLSGLKCEPMILSVRWLTSDCSLCKSDFACDAYGFLFLTFPQFRPLHWLLGCYRFLFAAILYISQVFDLLWLSVFVFHRYECEVNLSEFFDFSLEGVKNESNDASICLNILGTWSACGAAPTTFCFESWVNLFFDMDLSAIRLILQCELDSGRYLRR